MRHWKGCLIVVGIALVVFLLFSGLSSCSLFGGNTSGAVLASSYFSEDADMLGAEAAYTAMEEELRQRLENCLLYTSYPCAAAFGSVRLIGSR